MFGTAELIVIFCVALLLFGGKKLPELARSLGIGIREFKKALSGHEETSSLEPKRHHQEEKEDVVIVVEPKKEER